MKKFMMLMVLFFMTSFFTEKEASNVNINFGVFYSSLNPYGEWIQIDNNVVVWRPYDVGVNWSPYTVGRWEYTPDGWYWDSYESFGWATYHYGRWYYDNYYGWVWIPGYTWAPAWVEWRYNNSYIGWSPLPPFADFNASIGIHFSINVRTSYHHWCFVSYGHFHDPYVSHYFVPAREKNFVFNNTKYRTNYRYSNGRVVNNGVSRSYVESRSGNRIEEKSISRTTQMSDYTTSRTRSGDRVVAYQPGDSDVEKYRNVETGDVKRSTSNKTSLNRDMVSFRDNTDAANSSSRTTATSSRTAERGNSAVSSSRNSSTGTQTKSSTRSNTTSKSTTPTSTSSRSATSSRSTTKSNTNNSTTGQNSSTQSGSRSYKSNSSSNNSSGSVNRSASSSNSGSRSVSKSRSSSSSSSSQLKKSNTSSSSRTTTKKSSSSRSSQSNSSRSKSSSSRSR